MDTEYNKTQKNRKALILLLTLVVFGFICFRFTKMDVNNLPNTNVTVSASDSKNIVEETNSNPTFLSIPPKGDIMDITPPQKSGTVLGTYCGDAKNRYEADSACLLESSTSVDIDGSKFVNANAEIKIISIEVPVRLLSGIYSIKDSNAKITKDYPYYPPAGEVVKDKMVEINTPPGELHDEVKTNIIDDAIKQQAYSTKFTVTTSGKEESGDVTISEYAKNNCGAACENEANNNPDKSNKSARYLKDVYYTYPNQTNEEQVSQSLQIIGKCENADPPMEIETATKNQCFSFWNAIVGTLGSLFPSSDWTQCKEGGEGCINSEDIAIKISPMFEDTNSYTTTRNKVGMDPTSSKDYKSVYVVTQCHALVAKKETPVKCIWDMSYLFDERKVAEFDDVGGSDTPTLEEYKTFLGNESTTRTDTLYPM